MWGAGAGVQVGQGVWGQGAGVQVDQGARGWCTCRPGGVGGRGLVYR